MREARRRLAVILVLFLISVGVMELILRDDRKKQQDSSARDHASAPGTPILLSTKVETTEPASASAVTNSLLSLMDAVQGEAAVVEPELRHAAIESAPHPEPGDDGLEMIESDREYNREDAGVK
jgi:hypothetical protein